MKAPVMVLTWIYRAIVQKHVSIRKLLPRRYQVSILRYKLFRLTHIFIGIPVLICLPFFWVPLRITGFADGLISFYKETFQYMRDDKPWGPVDGCLIIQRNSKNLD